MATAVKKETPEVKATTGTNKKIEIVETFKNGNKIIIQDYLKYREIRTSEHPQKELSTWTKVKVNLSKQYYKKTKTTGYSLYVRFGKLPGLKPKFTLTDQQVSLLALQKGFELNEDGHLAKEMNLFEVPCRLFTGVNEFGGTTNRCELILGDGVYFSELLKYDLVTLINTASSDILDNKYVWLTAVTQDEFEDNTF